MERKIGEVFRDEQSGSIIKVVKCKNLLCTGCFYDKGSLSFCFDKSILNNRGECMEELREDKAEVKFKRVSALNVNSVTYITLFMISGAFWYVIFKIILGL